MTLSTVVETKELVSTVIASLVAGVGVTAVFSTLILAAARSTELRRDDRPLAAGVWGAVVVLAMALTAGMIVFGVIVMTQKS